MPSSQNLVYFRWHEEGLDAWVCALKDASLDKGLPFKGPTRVLTEKPPEPFNNNRDAHSSTNPFFHLNSNKTDAVHNKILWFYSYLGDRKWVPDGSSTYQEWPQPEGYVLSIGKYLLPGEKTRIWTNGGSGTPVARGSVEPGNIVQFSDRTFLHVPKKWVDPATPKFEEVQNANAGFPPMMPIYRPIPPERWTSYVSSDMYSAKHPQSNKWDSWGLYVGQMDGNAGPRSIGPPGVPAKRQFFYGELPGEGSQYVHAIDIPNLKQGEEQRILIHQKSKEDFTARTSTPWQICADLFKTFPDLLLNGPLVPLLTANGTEGYRLYFFITQNLPGLYNGDFKYEDIGYIRYFHIELRKDGSVASAPGKIQVQEEGPIRLYHNTRPRFLKVAKLDLKSSGVYDTLLVWSEGIDQPNDAPRYLMIPIQKNGSIGNGGEIGDAPYGFEGTRAGDVCFDSGLLLVPDGFVG